MCTSPQAGNWNSWWFSIHHPVTCMLLPCLCQILTFTPTFIFKVQHQFKNQFKNRLCLFLFNQQSLLCLSRDTCSINLCFVQRSLTLTLSMSQKATMQIFCIFTLLTLVFDNILAWSSLHYCLKWDSSSLCAALQESKPKEGYLQLFPGSNSINAETQENPGKHLLTGEEKGRAGYILLVCWSKRLVIMSTEITNEQILTCQIWA